MLAAALIVASAAISMYSASKQGEAEKESLDREIEYNGLLLAEEERKSIETIKMVTAKRDNLFSKIEGMNAAKNVDINGVGSAQDYWDIADKAQQDISELTHQMEVQRRLYEQTGRAKEAAKSFVDTKIGLMQAQTIVDTGYKAYNLKKKPDKTPPKD